MTTDKTKSIVLTFADLSIDADTGTDETKETTGSWLFTCEACNDVVLDYGDDIVVVAERHMREEHDNGAYTIAFENDNAPADVAIEEIVSDAIADVAQKYTCAGFTKSGNPCKRHVDSEGEYCYLHKPADAVVEAEKSVPAQNSVSAKDPFERFEDIARNLKEYIGGFIEDTKGKVSVLKSYYADVIEKENEVRNFEALLLQLEDLPSLPEVIERKTFMQESIVSLKVAVIDMKLDPRWVAYMPIADEVAQQKAVDDRIKEIAKSNEETKRQILADANKDVFRRRDYFLKLLHGEQWIPAQEPVSGSDGEPVIRNAWWRMNGILKKAGVDWGKRRKFGVYTEHLYDVFESIFPQYVDFDDSDTIVVESDGVEVAVPGFSREEAFRQFAMTFERVWGKFMAQKNKEGLQVAAKDYWGSVNAPIALRTSADGKRITPAKQFARKNKLDMGAVANFKGADALVALRRQLEAQSDDPNGEEPIR